MCDSPDTTYSIELRRTFTTDVIRRVSEELLSKSKSDVGANALDIAAGFIPVIGLLKSRTSLQSYRDYRMGTKLLVFFEKFAQNATDPDELFNAATEIDKMNGESFFETMMTVLDRIDNANKARILANILHHSIKGDITRDNYLRHSWILANVPFIDLQQLHKYTTDHYQSSSSEILYANGLIRETILDGGTFGVGEHNDGGNKFGLTALGEEMLHYGLYNREWEYKGAGKQINSVNSIRMTEL